MIAKIYKWSIQFSYLGIREDTTLQLTIKTRLLNIMYLVTTVWSFILMTNSLIKGNGEHIITILPNFIYKTICLLLNIYGKQYLAWMLLILGFSISTAWFWICIDSAWDPVFIYLTLIFLILIVFEGMQQFLLLIFTCMMYLSAPIIAPFVPEIYINPIETYPYVTEYSFVFYVILSGIILTFYQMEIRKDRQKQENTIHDLEEANEHLNIVKNDLEQFITVVSKELKIKVQTVKEENEKTNRALSKKENQSLLKPLETASDSAQHMYSLINETLE